MALQRMIGNQATLSLLQRGPRTIQRNGVKDIASHYEGIDKASKAGPSGPPPKPVSSGAAQSVGALAASASSAIEQAGQKGPSGPLPKPVSSGAAKPVGALTAEARSAINEEAQVSGVPTTLNAVAAMNAEAIARFPTGKGGGAGGPTAKGILKGAFGSNWFFAKDVLVYNRWPDSVSPDLTLRRPESGPLREELMWRLIGLRTWEYNDVLTKLRARYEADPEVGRGKTGTAVLEWGMAGSDTPTSDVDLNLKGECNMLAVGDFNADFVNRGWPYEAGTVYDVNVYCKDNMWDFSVDREGLMTTTSEPNAPTNLPQDKADSDQQEVAAMIKLIRFMSHGHALDEAPEWAKYKEKLTMTAQMETTVRLAEIGYAKWYTDLKREKERIAGSAEAVVDSTLMAADHVQKLEAAVDMRASNRLYERKIVELIAARKELAAAAASAVAEAELLGVARRVRQLVLEAAMFANEAMITAGASQFVVFGTQLGLKKGASKIQLSEGQLFHAFTEQLADTIKEFGHFDDLADGLLKGGKYLMRMTLAADQLDGVQGRQGEITNMAALRRLGDYAMSAKNMTGTIDAKLSVMRQALSESGIATDKKTLVAAIAQFGADVTNAYQAAKVAVTVPAAPGDADPAKAEKIKAVKAAESKKAGAELRQAQIKGADLAAAIEALNLGVNRPGAASVAK